VPIIFRLFLPSVLVFPSMNMLSIFRDIRCHLSAFFARRSRFLSYFFSRLFLLSHSDPFIFHFSCVQSPLFVISPITDIISASCFRHLRDFSSLSYWVDIFIDRLPFLLLRFHALLVSFDILFRSWDIDIVMLFTLHIFSMMILPTPENMLHWMISGFAIFSRFSFFLFIRIAFLLMMIFFPSFHIYFQTISYSFFSWYLPNDMPLLSFLST